MSINYNLLVGSLCIIAGVVIIVLVLGDLLVRVVVGLVALALINYGLKLRGLPPLQMLLPLIVSRKRWF